MFLSLVLQDYRIAVCAQLLVMIVITGRLSLLGFVFNPVSWLAGDSRLRHTISLRIHLDERQSLSSICPSTIISYLRSLEASLSTRASRSIASPIVFSLDRNKPVTATNLKWRKWVFVYPNEKWNTDCVEPTARRGERGISQMMTGFFYGQTHGIFLPVFPDPSSARGGVTGKSIIDVYDHYDFLGIWEDIREKVGEEEVFFIIDNAKTLAFYEMAQKAGNCSYGNCCLFTRSQFN